jgi:glycerate kinase
VALEEKIRGGDLVVTGEGRMDGQTVNGKTPAGVAAAARRAGVACIAICGCVGDGYEAVHEAGIAAVVPIAHGFFDPADPSMGARERISKAAEETGRLLALRAECPLGGAKG